MGHKIFVSYKYHDYKVRKNIVQNSSIFLADECHDYTNYLQKIITDDTVDIYKGEEDGDDLSAFADSTIETKLKKKIIDSSITIVLISKGMKTNESESEQWIPWEISYSIKEISSGGIKSHSNSMLAAVIPDENGSYDYFLDYCPICGVCTHKTNNLFQILGSNMFNLKNKSFNQSNCLYNHGLVHTGYNHSYIYQVKWDEFISNYSLHIDRAINIGKNIDDYEMKKNITKF